MSTTDRIERETTIEAPVPRVWAMLTEAEHLGRWLADAGAEIDLRPGGGVTLHWAEHGDVHGRIEEVVPEQRLTLWWAPYADPGGTEPREGNSTHIEFTLHARGDTTLLRVVESGFDALDCAPEQRIHNHGANSKGWDVELGHLRDHALRAGV